MKSKLTAKHPSHRLGETGANERQRAIALPMSLFFLLLISIAGISTLQQARQEERGSPSTDDTQIAKLAAQAALNDAIALFIPTYNTTTGQSDATTNKIPYFVGPWRNIDQTSLTLTPPSSWFTRSNYKTTSGAANCPLDFGYAAGCGGNTFTRAQILPPPTEVEPAWRFTTACTNGLCLANLATSTMPYDTVLTRPANQRIAYGSLTGATALAGVASQPYYIIEYLDRESTITKSYDGADQVASRSASRPITYGRSQTLFPKGVNPFAAFPCGSYSGFVPSSVGSFLTTVPLTNSYVSAARLAVVGAFPSSPWQITNQLAASEPNCFNFYKSCTDTFGWWANAKIVCTFAKHPQTLAFNQAQYDNNNANGTKRPEKFAPPYWGNAVNTNFDTLQSWTGINSTTGFGDPDTPTDMRWVEDNDCLFTANAGDVNRGFPSCFTQGNNWSTGPWLYLRPNYDLRSRYRITAVGFGQGVAKAVMQQDIYVEVMRWNSMIGDGSANGTVTTDSNLPPESCDLPEIEIAATYSYSGGRWSIATFNSKVVNSTPAKDNMLGYAYARGSHATNQTWGHANQFHWVGLPCSHWLGRKQLINADPDSPGRVNGYNPSLARYVYVRPKRFTVGKPRQLY